MSGASGGKDDPPDIDKATSRSAWGSNRPRGGPGAGGPSYSSITSINTSVRDQKNILEVRLEKQEGSRFNLTMEETEHLLRRLSIDSSHLLGVSACPEGRPVVLITLHSSVDITRFLYRHDKRKPEASPETAELSRKEKKMLKGEERKQDKMKKKLEYKQKNSVNVQINHSY